MSLRWLLLVVLLPFTAQAEEPTIRGLCDETAALLAEHEGDCAAIADALHALVNRHEAYLRETLPEIDASSRDARYCRKVVEAVVLDAETKALGEDYLVCMVNGDVRDLVGRLRALREPVQEPTPPR